MRMLLLVALIGLSGVAGCAPGRERAGGALTRIRIADLGDAVVDPHPAYPWFGERLEFPLGVRAYVDSGSVLAVHDPGEFKPAQLLGLRTGGALLLVPRDTSASAQGGTYVTWVGTRAGYVAAMAPVVVAIWMNGDTMTVRVHRHVHEPTTRDPFFSEHKVEVRPVLVPGTRPQFFLEPGESARVVRGQLPERLR